MFSDATAPRYSIGIDPGWKNLGLAIVEYIPDSYKVKPLLLITLNPSLYECPEECADNIFFRYSQLTKDTSFDKLRYLAIERYVAYANVKSSETENITSLIGMINMASWYAANDCSNFTKIQTRAIDWKVYMAQTLSKNTNFQNPSLSLDKKFSVAVAKELIENHNEIKTDHEADALCLAALPFVKEKFKDSRKSP